MKWEKRVREIEIEGPATEYAECRGWWEFKIMQASKNGIPDRFYARKGRIVFVEYKAPGEPATVQQLKRHAEMREAGIEVHIIDNMEAARELFR